MKRRDLIRHLTPQVYEGSDVGEVTARRPAINRSGKPAGGGTDGPPAGAEQTPRAVPPTIPPGISSQESPQFHRLGEFSFQCLCRDLFDEEPEVATCEVYGTRGQKQFGIDLLAHQRGSGIAVGQCKCVASLTAAEIRKASDAFLEHWEARWSKEEVKRFVLFVACDLDRTEQQDQVTKERERFREHRVEYEAWSATMIRNKLRPHPGIVSTYMATPPGYWADQICGGVSLSQREQYGSGSRQESPLLVGAILAQNEALAAFVTAGTEQDLPRARAAWREGKPREAKELIDRLRGDTSVWLALPPDTRAKVLRFQASLEINLTGDLSRAKLLAEEARALAPDQDQVLLQAWITHHESGAEAAQAQIAGHESQDALNLRALLVLQLGRVDFCEGILARADSLNPSNAETLRLHALAHLVRGDLDRARLDIQKAAEREPTWWVIRLTSVIVSYFSALSPAAVPKRLVSWPEPVHWALVRRDDESLLRLREAATVVKSLLELGAGPPSEQVAFEAWLLGCLANDPQAQDQAAEYGRTLLEGDATHVPAIAWSVARNFDIDMAPSVGALERLISSGNETVPHVVALINLYLASQRSDQALAILENTRPLFEGAELEALWTRLQAHSLVVAGKADAALEALDKSAFAETMADVRISILAELAKKSDEWGEVYSRLEEQYASSGDPVPLLGACQLKAQRGDWLYVSERAEQLVAELQTGDAVGLAATAAYNARDYALCMKLLDGHRSLFSEGELPSRFRQLRIGCLQQLGVLPQAVAEAQRLAEEDPTAPNVVNLARLYFEKGDLKQGAVVARRLVGRRDASTDDLLLVATWVQFEDRPLATRLWRQAVGQDLPDRAVGSAVTLGFQLGLDQELRPLFARPGNIAAGGEGAIRLVTIEEVVAFARHQREQQATLDQAYRSGAAPVHVILERARLPLVALYRGLLEQNASSFDQLNQPPLFARHGGRPLISGFPDQAPKWHLNADVTALLLAAHIGVLDQVETTFAPIRVSQSLAAALVRMLDELTARQPSRLEAMKQIDELVRQGLLHPATPQFLTDHPLASVALELGEELVALIEAAEKDKGFVLTYLPLRRKDLSGWAAPLPPDAASRIVNCRAVLDALREHGPLAGC